MSDDKYKNQRIIARVREQDGQYGKFTKIQINNPSHLNKDGSANTFYKGTLLWIDAETGKKFVVKQLSVKDVKSEKMAADGVVNILVLDLDSKYHVDEIE